MELSTRILYLRIALIVIGLIFIFGIYPLMMFWPSGWRWMPYQQHYEQMILGIYFVLGIFLIRAAKDPLENLSLIWFTIWSSFVHGGIMLTQALVYPMEASHLLGDVPALFIIGFILVLFTPRKKQFLRT